jgi:acetyl-CoA carboxylase biotin carboxyl carrier protein
MKKEKRMPRNGGQRAAARPAEIGSASRPRAVGGSELTTEASVEAGSPMIDLDFLRGLIEAVDAAGIDSIEFHRSGTRIRISKTPPPAPAAPVPAPAASAAPAIAAAPAQTAALPAAPSEPAPAAVSNLIDVKSPMVGTFYRQPAPEAPSYVEIGSTVKKGQTLCILEAMKLMNELESEVDGIVREVLVENSDPVEYGQVLFRIEPA